MNVYTQAAKYDCMLACIATLMQVPIDKLFPAEFRAYIEEVKGCYGKEVTNAFKLAGLHSGTDHHCVHIPSGMANSRTVIQLLQGRRAIIQVPSLNVIGATHLVLWLGEVLFDPSPLQKYSTLDQLVMQFVWVFEENPRFRKPTLRYPNELSQNPSSFKAEDVAAVMSTPEQIAAVNANGVSTLPRADTPLMFGNVPKMPAA